MRRNFFVLILSCLVLTSCYNTRIAVGDVSPTQPLIEINSHRNDILLYGLIPLSNASKRASEFVGNRENYVIRTNQTFINGLVSFFTFSIYTPTTTTYYIPIDDYNYEYGNNYSRNSYNNNRQTNRSAQPERYYNDYVAPAPERSDYDRPRSNAAPRRSNDDRQYRQEEPATYEKEYKASILYRNGGTVDATIIGDMNGETIKLRLRDGQIVESRMSDIKKINIK